MESCKILLAAIFVVTLSSVARTAPLNSPPNRVEILISLGLSPKLTNATEEVRNTMIFQCNFYEVSTERAVSYVFSVTLFSKHYFTFTDEKRLPVHSLPLSPEHDVTFWTRCNTNMLFKSGL